MVNVDRGDMTEPSDIFGVLPFSTGFGIMVRYKLTLWTLTVLVILLLRFRPEPTLRTRSVLLCYLRFMSCQNPG